MARTSWLERHGLALAASLAAAAGFAWLLHKGALPVLPRRDDFAAIAPWTVILYALLYLAALYVRAHRWAWLLAPIHPVPLRRVLTVSFIGYGALALLPFRTGAVVRPALIRRERELSGWAATGTTAAERVIDGLVLCVILLVALTAGLAMYYPPDRVATTGSAVVFLLYVIQVGLVLLTAAAARRRSRISPSNALAAGDEPS
jgi:glycosyltransferase 2 family protein